MSVIHFDKNMLIPIITFTVAVLGTIISILKQNKLWKWLGFILIILAAIFGLTDSYFGNEEMNNAKLLLSKAEASLEDTKRDLSFIQKYSYMAYYGPYGGESLLGPGLGTNSKLYNILEGTYYFKDSKFFYYCGNKFEKIYKQVIIEYPDFPFSYCALADCKKQRGESDWIDYADKGLEIFKWTTKIGGHKKEHDECMNNLLEFKNEFVAKGKM